LRPLLARLQRVFIFWAIGSTGLSLASQSIERMMVKVSRLYGQGATEQRIETYLVHWWRWVISGLNGLFSPGVWAIPFPILMHKASAEFLFNTPQTVRYI